MRAAEDTGAGSHVEEKLALYHLGELPDAEAVPMYAHLDECPECRAAQVQVCDVLGALAMLTEERRTLLNLWGALGSAEPEAFPERFSPLDRSDEMEGGRHRKLFRSARKTRKSAAGQPESPPKAAGPVRGAPAGTSAAGAAGTSAAGPVAKPALRPAPDPAVSGPAAPSPAVPGPATPGRAASAPAAPGLSAPGLSAPGLSAPGLSAPGLSASGPAASGPAVRGASGSAARPAANPALRAALDAATQAAANPALRAALDAVAQPAPNPAVRSALDAAPYTAAHGTPNPAAQAAPGSAAQVAPGSAAQAAPSPAATSAEKPAQRPRIDPDMPRPAVKSPAAARPAAAANPPAVTKPSPANSSPAKSDHTKSDHSKPDHTKPDHTKPEQAHAPAARTSRSRQRRKIVVTSCMLVGVVAFGGLAVSALVRGLPQDDAAPATAPVLSAEASAADRGTGAQMSVFLHEGEDGVAVRATLNKLRKGTGYRLYAQSFDGRRWPVVNWTGTAGVQEVEGAVPATLAEISHFTVLRSDRKTAVTVYLPRSAAPAPDAGSNGGGGAAGNGEAPADGEAAGN